GPEEWVK
nr:RecName: Full=46 kDa cell wall protein [Nicotiana tabacum]